MMRTDNMREDRKEMGYLMAARRGVAKKTTWLLSFFSVLTVTEDTLIGRKIYCKGPHAILEKRQTASRSIIHLEVIFERRAHIFYIAKKRDIMINAIITIYCDRSK